jgi:2-dehydro-3-deoxyphosphooctonate aldolase (KDO 8-P synthase)
MDRKPIPLGDLLLGQTGELFLLAGPCVVQTEEIVLKIAEGVKEICERLHVPYVFKASFDKANRTSGRSGRGPGMDKGLRAIERVKKELDLPTVTDVHSIEQAKAAAEVVDILQIPAFLCRQTDLLTAAAQTGCIVNIKKGQFMAPWDMKHAVLKVTDAGNEKVMITERGASFGYGNLVSDMRALPIMRDFGYPVVFDATHSLQLPGAKGGSTGGQREYIPHLARAAVATGVDGIFAEVHTDPSSSPSDSENMLRMEELEPLLKTLLAIKKIVP